MEDLKIDVKKIIAETRETITQVNLDGSPIEDGRYFRMEGERFGIIYHGGDLVKVVDHQPTRNDLKICNLANGSESAKKGAATRKARKTAQDSLRFLLSCSAEPAEARALIRTLTGGEMSNTMRNFFDVPEEENNLTQYDLVNLAMVTAAKNGDTKAATYVRDTMGDKIAEKAEISATFTDGDKSLLEKVGARLALLSEEYLTTDHQDEETS